MALAYTMTRAAVTIAYDGPALENGTMDVRDLAPALLAAGQLVDAANAILNGDSARVSVQVTATDVGSFEISLHIVQSFGSQVVSLFTSEPVVAASSLATLVFGTPAAKGLLWLIKKCRGQRPTRIEKLSESTVRLVIDGEVIEIPMDLLRLYQDLPVRIAAQRLVEQPLQKEGIDIFEVRENKSPTLSISKRDSGYFARPSLPEETLIDDTRRSAYSIISLAFKEDNKWRLNDGNNAISATIVDDDFQKKVDNNQVSFSKGDILICDVRITQKQTDAGLKTEYSVIKVIEHRAAARQIPLSFDSEPTAANNSSIPAGSPPTAQDKAQANPTALPPITHLR